MTASSALVVQWSAAFFASQSRLSIWVSLFSLVNPDPLVPIVYSLLPHFKFKCLLGSGVQVLGYPRSVQYLDFCVACCGRSSSLLVRECYSRPHFGVPLQKPLSKWACSFLRLKTEVSSRRFFCSCIGLGKVSHNGLILQLCLQTGYQSE